MPNIEVSIKNKIAQTTTENAFIICGNSDYNIIFNFDEEWNGETTKTALFVYNGNSIPVPFNGNVCEVPILRNTTQVKIGVFAGDLKTTTSAYVPCRKSITDEGGEIPLDPKPNVYNEIIKLVNEVSGEIPELGAGLNLSVDSDYVLTVSLINKDGETLSEKSVDLPIETLVVSAVYDDNKKAIIFTLQNGETLLVPVGDLVKGFVKEEDYNTLKNTVETNSTNIVNLDRVKQQKYDDNLITQSKEIVGAINEVKGLAEEARMIFGETEGTAYEGNKGKKNADDISKLNLKLDLIERNIFQSGLGSIVPLTEAFISRETANGANILDPSPTVVQMIKGKTVKSTNLIPFPIYTGNMFSTNYYPSFTYSHNGITYTVQDDGGIKLSGTITGDTGENYSYYIFAWYNHNFPEVGTYTISAYGLNDDRVSFQMVTVKDEVVVSDNTAVPNKRTVTHTFVDGERIQRFAIVIQGGEGKTVNGVIYPMLNEGSTAKPFVPYFSGLKHANFKSIKSTGKNVLKVKDYTITYGGVTVTVKDNKFTATGTATGHIELWLPLEAPLQAGTYSSILGVENALEGTGVTRLYLSPKDRDFANRKAFAKHDSVVNDITTNFVSNYMALYIPIGNEANCSLDLMLNIGSTAQPNEPYKVEEYTDGKSYELAEYDYINPQKGELIRQTGYTTSETGFTAEEIATYNEPIVSSDGLSLAYRLETPTIEKIDYPNEYTAYNGGSETVEQGDTDNSQWGAICEITNEYWIVKEI